MIGVSVLFLLWFLLHAKRCSCENTPDDCCRKEFYGFQYGHLFFFTVLGFLYPKQFKTWIIIGILWEFFEYWLSSRPDLVRSFGGCLTSHEGKDEGPLWLRNVYGGKPKHENVIDRMFGIKNSTEHTWHYSVGENLTNVVGFIIGSYIRNKISN